MPIYEFTTDEIREVPPTTFALKGIRERDDLQRLLRGSIDIVSPDTLIISEEFGDWTESRRRIDLLGIDKEANLVVIELNRTEDGGHMELQAVRYAAMVSTMTFKKAVTEYGKYLTTIEDDQDAEAAILDFLGWEEPNEEDFAQQVRIVLASAEFSKELTTSVIWLNEQGLDVRCVRLRPYDYHEKVIVDIQ